MGGKSKTNNMKWNFNLHFPIHEQEIDSSCGAACISMIAEWLTNMPQSEFKWRQITMDRKNTKVSGVRTATHHAPFLELIQVNKIIALERHLKKLQKLDKSLSLNQPVVQWYNSSDAIPVEFHEKWLDGFSLPVEDGVIYLASVDWYTTDSSNIGHWMVLLDLVEIHEDGHDDYLAILADPSEGQIHAWRWHSLLRCNVRYFIELKKT